MNNLSVLDQKFCNKCKTTKARSEFSANRGKLDGLQTYCKACSRLYQPASTTKKYYYPGRSKAYRQSQMEKDPVRFRSMQTKRRRRWIEAHPEQWLHLLRRKRAKGDGATILDLTLEQWQAILEKHNYCCAYCGKSTEKLTMDHIVPVSKGGQHTQSNVVPACSFCNTSKGSRDLATFLASRNK
jgi:5-methylcytosine-specific restriction endonuclease McrA